MQRIPSFSKIRLNNFLFKIDPKIMLVHDLTILNDIHCKIGKTNLEIAKSLGVSESYYKSCKQNRKSPPLWFLKRMERFEPKLINLFWESDIKYTVRVNKLNLPKKITPKLAYFIGYLQGDGYLGSDKKKYAFSDEYLDHLKFIGQLNVELFGNKGSLRMLRSKIAKKDSPTIEFRSNVVNSYLHKVFGIIRGVKHKLNVPKLFYKNKEILKWYLVGLFDADGTLPKKPEEVKQPFIDITMKNKEFMEEIKDIMKNKFGIETLKLYPRKSLSPTTRNVCITWELRIRRYSQIRRFLNEIGFFHFHKAKRASKLIKILPE